MDYTWSNLRVGDEVTITYSFYGKHEVSGFVDRIARDEVRLVSRPSNTSKVRAAINLLPGGWFDRYEVTRIELHGTEESRMHQSLAAA